MHVGFTGTQDGMTDAQKERLQVNFETHPPEYFHHGDCVGADAEAHELAFTCGLVIIHPPKDSRKRAFCEGAFEMREPLDYLARNSKIVDEVDELIAAPKEFTEQLRSGTWSTIRRARKKGIPIYLILPDGRMACEKAPLKPVKLNFTI